MNKEEAEKDFKIFKKFFEGIIVSSSYVPLFIGIFLMLGNPLSYFRTFFNLEF